MRRIIFAFTLLLFFTGYSQNPTDVIKIKEPNERYLEHLIKIKIDSVRSTLGIKVLANDSLLYVVAKSHGEYLNENSKSGHYQMNDSMKTPTLRLEKFGALGYMNTELVSSIYIHRPVKFRPNPNERETVTQTFTTYNEVANYVINEWSLDNDTKDHFYNPKYNVIGLNVIINQLNDCIKIVAFLGRPYLKYTFKENKEMFPFSNYKSPEPIKSFDNLNLSKVVDRPFKIKEGVKEKCTKCESALKDIKFEINTSGSKIYLIANDITNVEFSKFVSSSKNAVMLESIEYEDYHPGNPAYYEKNTRRNKTYLYNGEIYDPIWGSEMVSGFDEAKGTFKIMLARDPKITTISDFNVYFIYKGMQCKIERFTDPVGNPLALYDFQKLNYDIDKEAIKTLNYKNNRENFSIKIPFKNNQFELDSAKLINDIKALKAHDTKRNKSQITLEIQVPIMETSQDSTQTIDLTVKKLQAKIERILKNEKITYKITPSFAPLQDHYKAVKNDSKAAYTKEEWIKFLSDPKEYKANKSYLDKSWNASLNIIQYQDTLKELEQKYIAQMLKIDTLKEITTEEITKTKAIQGLLFSHFEESSDKLSTQISKLNFTNPKLNSIYMNQLAYNYNSIENHSEDTLKYFYDFLQTNYKLSNTSTPNKINFLKFSCNHMTSKPYDFSYRSNNLTSDLKKIETDMSTKEFEDLNNAFDIKLTFYYSNYTKASELFEKSLDALEERYKNASFDKQLQLALTLAYYGKSERVNNILTPNIGRGSTAYNMIALYNKINQSYVDIFGAVDSDYMNTLLMSIDNLGKERWCKQFVGKGNISFQIFDYLPIYLQYCEQCAPYDNAARKVSY
jgi:hypothetical protein